MQRINRAIYVLLRNFLPDNVAIYPAIGAEDAKYPFCIFTPESFLTKRTKDGVYGYIYQYTVEIFDTSFDHADKYADDVVNGINGVSHGKYEGMSISLTGGDTSFIDGAFVQRLTYEVKSP